MVDRFFAEQLAKQQTLVLVVHFTHFFDER